MALASISDFHSCTSLPGKRIRRFYRIKLGLVSSLFFIGSTVNAQYRQLQIGRDFASLAGSGLVFGTGLYLQNQVKPLDEVELAQLDKAKIWKFDRIACSQWSINARYFSDGLAVSSILLPTVFLANKGTRSKFYSIANVSLQSLALGQAIVNMTKLSCRLRPFVYNPNAPMSEKMKPDSRMSFFSAHTLTVSSTCFSFALAHKTYMPDSKANPYITAGAFILPAIEGFLRVKAGKHYPTDVIVGYLVGMGSAYLMHRLYLKPN